MAFLLISVGFLQSWNVALQIFNLCLISAIMTLGVNVQWGYAGLVNFGMMGFTALGGFAAVIISMPPIYEAWAVGGSSIILGLFVLILTSPVLNAKTPFLCLCITPKDPSTPGHLRYLTLSSIITFIGVTISKENVFPMQLPFYPFQLPHPKSQHMQKNSQLDHQLLHSK